jgi:hypothetical protein
MPIPLRADFDASDPTSALWRFSCPDTRRNAGLRSGRSKLWFKVFWVPKCGISPAHQGNPILWLPKYGMVRPSASPSASVEPRFFWPFPVRS